MKQKKIFVFVLIFVLVFSVAGPVMADEGEVPELPETEEPLLEDDLEGFKHPLLALFSAYYAEMTAEDCDDPLTPEVEECLPPEELDCDDPDTPELEECPPIDELDCDDPETPEVEVCEEDFGELIGQLHDDGMGFGVLAKFMLMSLDSQACVEDPEASEPVCNPVSVEELLALFEDGTGIGLLFKDYGKPDNPGVGGLKNAEKLAEKCPEDGSGPSGYCKEKETGKPDKEPKNKP